MRDSGKAARTSLPQRSGLQWDSILDKLFPRVPQTPHLARSCSVNATSEPSLKQVSAGGTSPDKLDSIFRTHYERVARVIGRVIHDRARAEELAVEVF